MKNNKEITIKEKYLEGLFNLVGELNDMLVNDYYYSFDLKMVGDLALRLKLELLRIQQGKISKELIKEYKLSQKENWEKLKLDWKDYGCSHCGYLKPNLFALKQNGDEETLFNYQADKDLVKISKKLKIK